MDWSGLITDQKTQKEQEQGYMGSDQEWYFLGKYTTVFQVVVLVILKCIEENLRRNYENQHIYISSDIQAGLKASR